MIVCGGKYKDESGFAEICFAGDDDDGGAGVGVGDLWDRGGNPTGKGGGNGGGGVAGSRTNC